VATTAPPGTLDAHRIREDFPALRQEVNGKPLVYLDNAATTQKPRAVLDALERYYRTDNANVHRGIHELSRRATLAYEEARRTLADFIGAPDPAGLVWTRGTTEAINLVAGSWALDHLSEGDEIVLTEAEHHSNVVPWQLAAHRTGARLRYLGLDDRGVLRLDELPGLLGPRTRLVALGHVSNALGTIHPVAEIVDEVRRRSDALVLVDGAQAVPHLPVDVDALGVDFYTFSGHKMCGPTGIGGLWARRELLERMAPYQGGGEMIRIVRKDESTWAEIPHKFEAGTPHIAGAVGLAAAARYLDAVGRPAIEAWERELARYALERLGELPGMSIYGPRDPAGRAAVISFTMGDAHPHDISTILDSEGVAVRAGHHCAQLVMQRYGIAATARASFYLYNTREDVDRLVDALGVVRGIFGAA
jgi:cysteine desulfurase/selenocysteine lyase